MQHGLFNQIKALPTEQARLQTLMASPYSTDSARLRRMLTDPKEGDFWEACVPIRLPITAERDASASGCRGPIRLQITAERAAKRGAPSRGDVMLRELRASGGCTPSTARTQPHVRTRIPCSRRQQTCPFIVPPIPYLMHARRDHIHS